MTAPLCAKCGEPLPNGHPKSVITCPGCGARSLPQEAPAVPGSPEWDRLQAKYGDPEREEWAERMAQQIAAAHAAGVAEERARCLAIVGVIRTGRGTPEAEIACKLIELRIEDPTR